MRRIAPFLGSGRWAKRFEALGETAHLKRWLAGWTACSEGALVQRDAQPAEHATHGARSRRDRGTTADAARITRLRVRRRSFTKVEGDAVQHLSEHVCQIVLRRDLLYHQIPLHLALAHHEEDTSDSRVGIQHPPVVEPESLLRAWRCPRHLRFARNRTAFCRCYIYMSHGVRTL